MSTSTAVMSSTTSVDIALMLGIDPFAHGVDRDAQIFHAAAGDEIGNDKIINRTW